MEKINSFAKVLSKIELIEEKLRNQIISTRKFYQNSEMQYAYEQSINLEETSERMVLLTRILPAYTGFSKAKDEVENLIQQCIPIKIGFTAERWFSLQIPSLLPKKATGSADYIRSILYPAMRNFFEEKPPVRYWDCVLAYRHVYDSTRPERAKRDHDNIEVNMVSDIIAMYVMPDDGPSICSHYYCSAVGTDDRTEVYVIPKNDFPIWFGMEKEMPDEGVILYENQ